MKIVETETGKLSKTLTGHTQQVDSLTYHRSGSLLASGSADSTIRIWDLGSDAPARVIEEHKGSVVSVEFSAEGSKLLSASHDGRVIIWDVESLRPRNVFAGHQGRVAYATISSDGEWVASIGTETTGDQELSPAKLIVWNTRTLEQRFSPHSTSANWDSRRHSLAFSPDGKWLAYASPLAAQGVMLFDAVTGKLVRDMLEPGGKVSFTVTFSPDSQRVAMGTLSTTSIWDVRTGLEVLPGVRFTDAFTLCLKFSPDSKRLAAATYGNTVGILDTTLHATMHPRSRESALKELESASAP